MDMTWLHWSLLSAAFAALTAVFAKVGVSGVDSNVATAIRTSMVVVFTWIVAFLARDPSGSMPSSRRTCKACSMAGSRRHSGTLSA